MAIEPAVGLAMTNPQLPPKIFSNRRRIAARRRALRLQSGPDAARFLLDDMIEETGERLAFLREEPSRALVIGDLHGRLQALLEQGGTRVTRADIAENGASLMIDLEQPYPTGNFDFIACLGLLDTVNDLPGALIHIHSALAPGGLAIASFVGAGSLPVLRRVMLAADADRPAARMHPLVDVRAGGQLLGRAGWSDPVVDSQHLTVAYRSLDRLVGDLHEQGLGNVLAEHAPLDRKALARARAAFNAERNADGRVLEAFAILSLTGRRRA